MILEIKDVNNIKYLDRLNIKQDKMQEEINHKYVIQKTVVLNYLLDFILELLLESKGGHLRSSNRYNNRQWFGFI
jgi:hypothetical protein